MKFTGVSRPIDELGRIVIPKEIRNALELKPKDEMEIYIEEDKIVLKKARPICALCGEENGLISVSGKFICKECLKKVHNLSK